MPVSLPSELVARLDSCVYAGVFRSRSQALRYGARLVVREEAHELTERRARADVEEWRATERLGADRARDRERVAALRARYAGADEDCQRSGPPRDDLLRRRTAGRVLLRRPGFTDERRQTSTEHGTPTAAGGIGQSAAGGALAYTRNN